MILHSFLISTTHHGMLTFLKIKNDVQFKWVKEVCGIFERNFNLYSLTYQQKCEKNFFKPNKDSYYFTS